MKVAIMQPYFFPYIGYWQLMNVVDIFVVYDDVNYINRGWISRNNILINGQSKLFNMQLIKASQNKLINEIEVNNNKKANEKLLKTIELNYKKAPYFSLVYPIIKSVVLQNEKNAAVFLTNSLKAISQYLSITPQFITSSNIEKNINLKGQDKIIEICKILGATTYINPIGGIELYNREEFLKNDINLKFIKTNSIEYNQFNHPFVPNLSIIDVMMFNSHEEIKEMLASFEYK